MKSHAGNPACLWVNHLDTLGEDQMRASGKFTQISPTWRSVGSVRGVYIHSRYLGFEVHPATVAQL